jgi:ornithine cyclodeaminase/alanine dehydrogenase-like protein (mu-crystallin family)
MLLLSNVDIAEVLDMETTMSALEDAYVGIAEGRATCRPRIDLAFPTSNPGQEYRWGTMEGGATGGYFAIRMKSDVLHWETAPDGTVTREKFCGRPGLYLGLILLTSTETGLPLALIQDGVLQHMRVGGDGGIGVRHMARKDASVVGMLGSGGMAKTHVQSFLAARPGLRTLKVYSPTKANRESFAQQVRDAHGLEVVVCERPEAVYEGAHIVAALTDATAPVLDGDRLEKGAHVVNIGGGGLPDARTLERVDVCLRMGNAPAPEGLPPFDQEYLTWRAGRERPAKRPKEKAHGAVMPERQVTLKELHEGRPGRTSDDQITWSERGNLQGAQFFSVAGRAYEAARDKGLGREIPDDWLLQTIRN